MAQMESSAKKLPANLANRNFKAEADKAKTPAERDRLLNLRTTKLGAMAKIGDKNAPKFAKGDEKARGQAAAKRATADAASAGITMSKATRPIIEARAAKAASAAERAGKATAPPAGAAQAAMAKGTAAKPAGAKSTALAMTKATKPIIEARVAKAAGTAPVAAPAKVAPKARLADAKARIRAEFQSGVSPSDTRMAERKARRAERRQRMDGAKARIRAEFQAKK